MLIQAAVAAFIPSAIVQDRFIIFGSVAALCAALYVS